MIKRVKTFLASLWRQFGLVGGLILAIAVSIFLSVALWQSPGKESTATDSDATDQLVTAKPLNVVYGFEQLLVNTSSRTESVVDFRPTTNDIVKRIRNWRVDRVQKENVSRKQLVANAQQADTLLLSFPDAVSADIIKAVLGNHYELPKNAEITNVRVPRHKPDEVVLMDQKHQIMYRFKVLGSPKQLSNINIGDQQETVSLSYQQKRLFTTYENPVTLRSYRYLVATGDESGYLPTLFTGSKQTPAAQKNGAVTTYNDGVSKQLQIDEDTGLVTFNTYRETELGKNFNQRLQRSYDWLARVRQLPDNIYYFESHDRGKDVIFRLYANGLPIFNITNFGTVRVQQMSATHEELSFTRYSLQVPLPSKDADNVTLPATKTVLHQLATAGVEVDKLQDLCIGYRWVSAKDQTTVELQPEWYMEIGDTWEAVNDVLARMAQEG